MLRTNIYLEEAQSRRLAKAAKERGLSRAELIRRFIDRGLSGSDTSELQADLAAIDNSFGALAGHTVDAERTPGDRERHLNRMWEL